MIADTDIKDGTTEVKKPAARGKWTAQRRIEIVEASRVAGASINEVAARYGVRPRLLSAWRRRDAEATATSKHHSIAKRFAAVRVKDASSGSAIEIDLAGGLVRVLGIVDVGMLREVLAAVR